jgi:UDP-N-acetylmuramate dehydrogenase
MHAHFTTLQYKFGKTLQIKENTSKYSWFTLGGPAEVFFRPENIDQLKEFLIFNNNKNNKINIIGAGSNTLIRDRGVEGIVIKLSPNFSNIELLEHNIIEVGAATLDRKLSDFAKNNKISSMEFLSCIPGSIGGAIIMNSGCYGDDISKILLSIKVLDYQGQEKEIKNDQIQFCYRGSDLPSNLIILSAKFKGVASSKELIDKKQNELILRKKKSQPSQIKTGGSTFKNNNDKKAWMLIKESGCDKFKIGDAKISEKHCNFFVNNGKAKASDVEALINKVKKEVKIKTGVNLDLEIKIIGDEE